MLQKQKLKLFFFITRFRHIKITISDGDFTYLMEWTTFRKEKYRGMWVKKALKDQHIVCSLFHAYDTVLKMRG